MQREAGPVEIGPFAGVTALTLAASPCYVLSREIRIVLQVKHKNGLKACITIIIHGLTFEA